MLLLAAVMGFEIGAARADEGPYRVEPVAAPAPDLLAAPIRDALAGSGVKVVDSKGKTYAEIWLRKETPAKSKPTGPNGNVLYPVLAPGELLGAIRFPGQGVDFRDQVVEAGVYTLRYGLHPVDGNHQDVSEFRDFVLMVPVKADQSLARLEAKPLQKASAEATGTSHPGILLLTPVPDDAPAGAGPTLTHDEVKETWGLVAPLRLKTADDSGSGPVDLRVRLVVVGVAE